MSRQTLALQGIPHEVKDVARRMGIGIAVARKKRRMTMEELARAMFVDVRTLRRLERGEPSVSLGVALSAAWCLGLDIHVEEKWWPDKDELGIAEDVGRYVEKRRVR